MINASNFRSEAVKMNFMFSEVVIYSQFSFRFLKLVKGKFNKTEKWT